MPAAGGRVGGVVCVGNNILRNLNDTGFLLFGTRFRVHVSKVFFLGKKSEGASDELCHRPIDAFYRCRRKGMSVLSGSFAKKNVVSGSNSHTYMLA